MFASSRCQRGISGVYVNIYVNVGHCSIKSMWNTSFSFWFLWGDFFCLTQKQADKLFCWWIYLSIELLLRGSLSSVVHLWKCFHITSLVWRPKSLSLSSQSKLLWYREIITSPRVTSASIFALPTLESVLRVPLAFGDFCSFGEINYALKWCYKI